MERSGGRTVGNRGRLLQRLSLAAPSVGESEPRPYLPDPREDEIRDSGRVLQCLQPAPIGRLPKQRERAGDGVLQFEKHPDGRFRILQCEQQQRERSSQRTASGTLPVLELLWTRGGGR